MSNTLKFLIEKFAPANAISLPEFREFAGISASTDWRAMKSGKYPKAIKIGNHERILLTDLAAFLDAGGSSAPMPRKQGRPVGSRNKPKPCLEIYQSIFIILYMILLI